MIGWLCRLLRRPPPLQERVLDHLTARGELTARDMAIGLRCWSGDLYPVLARMERQDLIVSRWAVGPFPRPRLYSRPEDGA